jgi:two-component system OmpR family sensor kinase
VDRARAFDRFWQSAYARPEGRAKDHFGLGLAIVRELVVSDGGHVRLDAALSGGLEVVVHLRRGDPVAAEPPARQLSTTSG